MYTLSDENNHQPVFFVTTLANAERTFSSPHIWNSIPLEIRSKTTINSFKSHLKTFYFQSFVEQCCCACHLVTTRVSDSAFCGLYARYKSVYCCYYFNNSFTIALQVNCGRSCCINHHIASNLLLQYLAKFECSTYYCYSIQSRAKSFIYGKFLSKMSCSRLYIYAECFKMKTGGLPGFSGTRVPRLHSIVHDVLFNAVPNV